jgi:hypothetical protein
MEDIHGQLMTASNKKKCFVRQICKAITKYLQYRWEWSVLLFEIGERVQET